MLLITVLLAACGQNNAATGESGGTEGGEKKVTIRYLSFEVEIAEQLSRMFKEYEALNPGVTIMFETIGSGADSASALRAKFNSGNEPDIFQNGGYSELDLWIDHLEDLSDEPWAKNVVEMAREPITRDGKLYGQPLKVEGYGFIYNKDLFKKAGITKVPETLAELEEVANQLQNAGITPFLNPYGEWWIIGNHLANIPFAYQEDPNSFIKGLNEGTKSFASNEVFNQWLDLVDLTLKYGNKNPLQVDYNTQLTEFATGKAAMTQQGNWASIPLLKANPDLNIGFLPMPINNDAASMNKLPIGVPNYWVLNKKSDPEVKKAAKALLNWMVSNEEGQHYLMSEFKQIPAIETVRGDKEVLGQLAGDVMRYMDEGKTISWNWFKFPAAEATSHYFADALQAYSAGKMTREELLAAFQNAWKNLNNS
ncbi:ABC transporter substrate-binding protein [Paenibacillus paeoniae]|nr:ABC transporter substrate-binding protein [Paenibacillus paeoniae]